MAMGTTYKNAIADYGATLIPYLGLVDSGGTELTGGDPAYARIAAAWASASSGIIRPASDLTFNVPAGSVGAWRAYTASSGGSDYGGASLTIETYAAQGTYKLLAASSGIKHIDPA